jgi:hypothetical protein
MIFSYKEKSGHKLIKEGNIRKGLPELCTQKLNSAYQEGVPF